MTTITEPAVLFRLPDDVGLALRREHRGFVLHDDPEDTRMVNVAWEIARELDAEAGASVRARLGSKGRDSRAYHMRQAERMARLGAQLREAINGLDERWSKKGQVLARTAPEPIDGTAS